MTKNNFIIYKATSPSGKFYIGMTGFPLSKRKKEHQRRKTQSRSKFHSALLKYRRQMQWEVLVSGLTLEEAAERETQLIRELKPAYNMTEGGEHPRGYRHTAETKAKMSEIQKSRPWQIAAAREARKRKVIDIDTGIVYASIKEATLAFGVSRGVIANILQDSVKYPRFNLKYYEGGALWHR